RVRYVSAPPNQRQQIPWLCGYTGILSFPEKAGSRPDPAPLPGVRDNDRPDPVPVPGIVDAACPVTRSVPVVKHLDPLDPSAPVHGMEEASPRSPVPYARPVPMPRARLVQLVVPRSSPVPQRSAIAISPVSSMSSDLPPVLKASCSLPVPTQPASPMLPAPAALLFFALSIAWFCFCFLYIKTAMSDGEMVMSETVKSETVKSETVKSETVKKTWITPENSATPAVLSSASSPTRSPRRLGDSGCPVLCLSIHTFSEASRRLRLSCPLPFHPHVLRGVSATPAVLSSAFSPTRSPRRLGDSGCPVLCLFTHTFSEASRRLRLSCPLPFHPHVLRGVSATPAVLSSAFSPTRSPRRLGDSGCPVLCLFTHTFSEASRRLRLSCPLPFHPHVLRGVSATPAVLSSAFPSTRSPRRLGDSGCPVLCLSIHTFSEASRRLRLSCPLPFHPHVLRGVSATPAVLSSAFPSTRSPRRLSDSGCPVLCLFTHTFSEASQRLQLSCPLPIHPHILRGVSATPAVLSSAFSPTRSQRRLSRGGGSASFSTKLLIIVIYRPPGSLDHFIDELDILLNQFPIDGNPLILLGDFNLPSDKLHSSCILPLLTAFDLALNRSPPTHKAVNVLDLIFTHTTTTSDIAVIPLHLSDHHFLSFSLSLPSPSILSSPTCSSSLHNSFFPYFHFVHPSSP
ncbi:hypothetical protein P4O66_022208, partial [Electrophorus voltai]